MYYGPELTAQSFADWAEAHKIQLIYIQPGKPNQNAFIERFNRSFRTEVLDANLFNSIEEVQEAADHWVVEYNEYRPHESLGYLPPSVFKPRDFYAKNSIFDMSTWQVSLRHLLQSNSNFEVKVVDLDQKYHPLTACALVFT